MKNITIKNNGNGNINLNASGQGKVSLRKKIIWQSYGRSFNGYKYDFNVYNQYVSNVNNGDYGPLIPISIDDISIYFEMYIHYFRVGNQVLLQGDHYFGGFDDFIGNLSFYDSGYGLGAFDIVYYLNIQPLINKYLKFYPASESRFVVECYNDEPITLILGDLVDCVYDNVNDVCVTEYHNVPNGSAYWYLGFNDWEKWGSSSYNYPFTSPCFEGLSLAYDDNPQNTSQFDFRTMHKLN